MRKAGLLDQKPMKATPKMTAAAKNDTGTVKYTKYAYSPSRTAGDTRSGPVYEKGPCGGKKRTAFPDIP